MNIAKEFNIVVGAQLDSAVASKIRKQLKEVFEKQYDMPINVRHILKSINQVVDAGGKVQQTFGSIFHEGKAYDFTLDADYKVIGKLTEEVYTCESAVKLLTGAFSKLRSMKVGSVDFNKMLVEASGAAKEVERRFGKEIALVSVGNTGFDLDDIYKMAETVERIGAENVDFSNVFSGVKREVKNVENDIDGAVDNIKQKMGDIPKQLEKDMQGASDEVSNDVQNIEVEVELPVTAGNV